MIPAWIAFLIVIALILVFSKKELGIILSIGTIIFGILTQVSLLESFIAVVTSPSIILLAIAVALIPILGGIMEESGLMVELIQKMKISKKASLIVSPAFFGLLPVPGGALMSAPFCMRSVQTSARPLSAAHIRGVLPSSFLALMSAPLARSISTAFT